MNVVEVQKYIIDRVLELLHKETLDTYRVRNNNVFTSLIETRDIICRCSEMKVKTFETVKYLALETIELLKADTCIQFQLYSKELLVSEIEEFIKKSGDKLPTKFPDVERILFCLNKCIDQNAELYLPKLLGELDSLLGQASVWADDQMIVNISKLNSVICALCVQLIYEGYSKQFLFLELKYKAGISFDEFYKTLKEFAKKKRRRFEIIWCLYIKEDRSANLEAVGFKSEVNLEHFDDIARTKFAKKVVSAKYRYFYQETIDALDRFSAARQSREKLMKVFDALHLGVYSKILELPDTAIVLERRTTGWYAHNCVAGYFLDGSFAEDYALSAALLSTLDRIYQSKVVSASVKDRIRSAIRHLNYGDLDSEIGQRFINYWIALEFIFASPHTSENTFTRLKSYLIDVLSVSYVRRNMDYLKEKLVAEGFIASDYNLWESSNLLDAIADRVGLPLIWKYKLKVMKSRLFTHSDKLKEYYKNHTTNLERHIARIYNLRNVLVHEGAINQDVENLASNLRYYLVFLLDQLIDYFSSNADKKGRVFQMDDFFNEYRSYRRIIDATFSLDTLLSIPVIKKLW